MNQDSKKRIVIGLTGASGAALGIRILEILKEIPEIETHLITSEAGRMTIVDETNFKPSEVEALADVVHSNKDLASPLASGTTETIGMIVVPCSIKTLSAIANCYDSDLMTRAGDVTLKEGRPLLMVVREAPLHQGHLRLMKEAAEMGAIIYPPVPAFYAGLSSIEDMIDNMAGRILDRMGINNELFRRWEGLGQSKPK